jgi:hypothetical protein
MNDAKRGFSKLTPEQQARFEANRKKIAAKGKKGKKGKMQDEGTVGQVPGFQPSTKPMRW